MGPVADGGVCAATGQGGGQKPQECQCSQFGRDGWRLPLDEGSPSSLPYGVLAVISDHG
jgi:hypothetical protein